MNLPSGLGHSLACGLHPLVMFEGRGTVRRGDVDRNEAVASTSQPGPVPNDPPPAAGSGNGGQPQRNRDAA